MKRFLNVAAMSVFVLSLGACAEQNGWTPTVDAANDPHAATLNNDMYACGQLAHRAADQESTVGTDTAVGAVGGAAGGALLGAIAGGPATGAALGAVIGTGSGFGMGASRADERYRSAYTNCLRQRGHPVVN